jgi:hexokinase
VNLESGNFHPPHLTKWDDQLDAQTDNQGRQRFEKAVSGAYLGHLLALACPGGDFDPAQGAQALVQLCSEASAAPELKRQAQAILDRSSDLVAASLAGLVAAAGDVRKLADAPSPKDAECRRVRIVAEGGLFWGAPGYADRVREALARLTKAQGMQSFLPEILAVPDANLRGTALAALSGR